MAEKSGRSRPNATGPLAFVLALMLALSPASPVWALGDEPGTAEVYDYGQLGDAILDGAPVVRLMDDMIPMTDDSLMLRKKLRLDLNGHQLGSSDFELNLFANGKPFELDDSTGNGVCWANLYGASEQTGLILSTSITIFGGNVRGNIYGGGVSGGVNSASVFIAGGSIFGNIYGGSKKDPVTDPDITVSGGAIGGEVSGSSGTITFVNYGSSEEWAELPVIENAKDVVLDNSFVKVTDSNSPFGDGEGQVKNLTVPSGSGISVPNGGAIAGDFNGGGTLVLSGGAFEVGGEVKEQTTVVIEADQPVKGMEYIKTESAGGNGAFVPENPDWNFDGGGSSWVLDGEEYDVDFDSRGGTPTYASLRVLSGSRIAAPEPEPRRDGYSFLGWHTSGNGEWTTENAFSFRDTRIYENTSLAAAWKAETPPDTSGGGVAPDPDHDGGGGNGSGSGSHRRPSVSADLSSQGGISPELPPISSEPAMLPTHGAIDHFPYMEGDPDGRFRPDAWITRAEAAVLFAKADPNYEAARAPRLTLSDVPEDSWYADAVYYNLSEEIITGLPDGSFGPERKITRAEFATLIGRFLGLSNSGSAGFGDARDCWAEGYVAQLAEREILHGYPDGSFRPAEPVTRAEAACAINKVLGRAPNAAAVGKNAGKYEFEWKDVNPEHWGFAEILEATVGHAHQDFH